MFAITFYFWFTRLTLFSNVIAKLPPSDQYLMLLLVWCSSEIFTEGPGWRSSHWDFKRHQVHSWLAEWEGSEEEEQVWQTRRRDSCLDSCHQWEDSKACLWFQWRLTHSLDCHLPCILPPWILASTENWHLSWKCLSEVWQLSPVSLITSLSLWVGSRQLVVYSTFCIHTVQEIAGIRSQSSQIIHSFHEIRWSICTSTNMVFWTSDCSSS